MKKHIRIYEQTLRKAAYIVLAVFFCSCQHSWYENDGATVTLHIRDNICPFIVYVDTLDADPQTFRALSDNYACDKDHLFSWSSIIEGMDGSTCRLIDGGHPEINDIYIVDDKHVCRSHYIIEGRDPATFRVVQKYLTEDKNDFYWWDIPINVADKESFVLLEDPDDPSDYYYWARDKYYAYRLGTEKRFPIADYKTFHLLSSYYAADKYQVYNMKGVVKGADPATFKLPDEPTQFRECYSNDKDNVEESTDSVLE